MAVNFHSTVIIQPGTGAQDELDFIVEQTYRSFRDVSNYPSLDETTSFFRYYLSHPAESIITARDRDRIIGFSLYSEVEHMAGAEFQSVDQLVDHVRLAKKISRLRVPMVRGASRMLASLRLGQEIQEYDSAISDVELDDLYKAVTLVLPEYRGQGVGLAMTEYICNLGREKGSRQIFTHCLVGSGSVEMNTRAGFEPILGISGYYPNGADCLILGKILDCTPFKRS